MAFITLDFETYYDKDLGFKTQTNEEYLNDPRFEVIGVAVRIDEEPTRWFSGTDEETGNWLRQFDWEESALLCHNAMFDGAILSWRYGIVPKMYYDTLCMARAVHGTEVGNSLAKLAEYYGIGVKGTEVVNAFGKRRRDFNTEDLARYGDYCKNDVDLTYELFWRLAPRLQESEHKLIDMTLRMYTQPVLHLNDAVLLERLEEVQAEKSEMLRGLMSKMGVDSEEAVRAKLASNPQFYRVLLDFGVTPPMKISPKTGKSTYAFAKNDVDFIALTEHEDPMIQQLCAVRLGTKSTIEESRITRFIDTGARNKGLLPVPLKYYGAHTGRWSGQDGVNLQNLPSRDKKKKALKNAIQAPHDHYIVNCDSSQIEARVLAWLAGQQDVVEAFAQKRDIYCEDASKVYGRVITKADPIERFVGKTMRLGLGYGTGAAKLQHTLETTPPGAKLALDECKGLVNTWRSNNPYITALWREADQALEDLMSWPTGKMPYWLGKQAAVLVTHEGLLLPNNCKIRYKNLRRSDGKIVYDGRKGTESIWGGTVVENVVQALARIIVGEQMIKMSKKYRPVLTVHDAAVILAPKPLIEDAIAYVTKVMSTPPDWCATLPVACEAKYGETYGEC
jgi:DNA polymerase I-like protein with 3'-5' exonuclease and polymerase domains